MKNYWLRISVYVFTICLLSGCIMAPTERYNHQHNLALNDGFVEGFIETEGFHFASWSRLDETSSHLIIYIEGDGLAWLSKQDLSKDPTPIKPMAYLLARTDPRSNIVYLARPCQYTLPLGLGQNCDNKLWSSHRFSASIVRSMNDAVNALKRKTNAETIELIGYSGGGAIAVLIASLREDVSFLRTVAGNLDHVTLNRHHNVSPLRGSLNPLDVIPLISQIHQVHYTGQKDKTVPSFITRRFVSKLHCKKCGSVIEVSKATHSEGWIEKWRDLLKIKP